jgi:hypothetical protein
MGDMLEDRVLVARYASAVRRLEASQPGWEAIARLTLAVYSKAAIRRSAQPRTLETIGEAA